MMNNMNNFGINQMNINPMPMNFMGLNNQQNLLDENALRIKNIIAPYETKIKQLEEIIREKDFEIALLKDKLNNNNIFNNQNQNFMNMNPINPMNMMMPNPNPNQIQNQLKGKEINITFNYYQRCENYHCYEEELGYTLFEKLNPNSNWYLLKYFCNGKVIHPFLTIKENGIKEGDIIWLNNFISIRFDLDWNSKIINADDNYCIKDLINFYLLRIGKEGCFEEFYFLYNAERIDINDKSPIKIKFNNGSRISVISKNQIWNEILFENKYIPIIN